MFTEGTGKRNQNVSVNDTCFLNICFSHCKNSSFSDNAELDIGWWNPTLKVYLTLEASGRILGTKLLRIQS